MHRTLTRPDKLADVLRTERRVFAAKVRIARAVLGWSQTELGARVGLTQRAIYKLEQGDTEPRRATVHAMAAVWRDEGLHFETHGSHVELAFSATVLAPEAAGGAVSAR